MVGSKNRPAPREEAVMNPVADHYIQQHQSLAGNLPGQHVDWIEAQRCDGIMRFQEIGFPTQRDENWRYTTLKPITAKRFSTVDGTAGGPIEMAALAIDGLDSNRLVFVDKGDHKVHVKAGKSSHEAAKEILLKVGKNSIKIDKQGVTIKCLKFALDAKTKAEMKSLNVDIKGSAATLIKGGVVKIN